MDLYKTLNLLFLMTICFSKVLADRSARAIVKRAVEDTNSQIAAENAANQNQGNIEQIRTFLSSNEFIHLSAMSSRVQINALKDFQQNSSLTGEEFWEKAKTLFGSTALKLGAEKYTKDGDDIVIDSPIDHCPLTRTVNCTNHIRYRTSDGTCNNLEYPLDGSANRAYSRMIKPDYFDGIEEPRPSKNGGALPSARFVSTTYHGHSNDSLSNFFTAFLMTFGQFVDHDLDRTAVAKNLDQQTGHLYDLPCGNDGCNNTGIENKECYPIPIPGNDPFYPPDKTCVPFTRSAQFMKENCDLGPREQANSVTGWLDGSMIYGSSKCDTDYLRCSDPTSGKMRTSQHPNFPHWKPFLPTQNDPDCKGTNDFIKCFKAGDTRQNDHPALIATHTMFVRLHNKFEEEFRKIHPQWDGETLFQESRRLVVAVFQSIVYQEYLPIILGQDFMKKLDLTVGAPPNWQDYNPAVTADIINSFTIAFRFGHSQIPTLLKYTTPQRNETSESYFSDVLFQPESVWREHFGYVSSIDAIAHAQAMQESYISDQYFTPEITYKLFKEMFETVGSDLVARDIQRNRDHGLPSYVAYRKLCNLTVPEDLHHFDSSDLLNYHQNKHNFSEVYEHLDDIDLFSGGMSETPILGGLVGPVFACIIGRQFHNLKLADRFWFENSKVPTWAKQDPKYDYLFEDTKFTKEQIANIKIYTTGSLYCDTLDAVGTIQPNVMLQPLQEALSRSGLSVGEIYEKVALYKGNDNNRVTCDNHPRIDFSLYKNRI